MPTTLTDRLCALAREAGAPAVAPPGAVQVPGGRTGGDPVVLADRPDGTVVGLGAVVAKAHPPGSGGHAEAAEEEADAGELTVRLRTAAHPRLSGVLLPPLGPDGTPATSPRNLYPRRLADGRLATLWPRGTAVSPDAPEAAPWQAAGALLARLHAVPPDALTGELSGPLPPMRGPAKAARAMQRMRAALGTGSVPPRAPAGPALAEAARTVERAWTSLPAWCRAEALPPPSRTGVLCHGGFHLGQLVGHPPPEGPWQLIDVDDLGLGDPAWDLARPAAWYAAGLLHAADWNSFLSAYQHAAGLPPYDPWPRLDAPARALTTQTAALAVAKAHVSQRPLDEAEMACVEACARIAGVERDSTSGTTSTTSAVSGPSEEAGA